MQVFLGAIGVILVIAILFSVGFIVYHTVDNVINNECDFGEAFGKTWTQYTEFLEGLFGTKAEKQHEFEFKISVK